MPQPISRRNIVRLFAVATVLVTVPGSGSAQVEDGWVHIQAFDSFNGVFIGDICISYMLPGDTTPMDPIPSGGLLPIGTYDIEVADCAGIYEPQVFENVDVVSPDSNPMPEFKGSRLTAYLDMTGEARITGLARDSYSRYPLEDLGVNLVDPASGETIAVACTNEDGIYTVAAAPGEPVLLHFVERWPCDGTGFVGYEPQWHPFETDESNAVAVTPQIGEYVVAHAALDIDGGFVGRIVDPTGEIPGVGYQVSAWQNNSRNHTGVRGDGSFTIGRRGVDISLRIWSTRVGYDQGFLTEPDNPSQIATWDVSWGEVIDVGVIGAERPVGISGRVVDSQGIPIENAWILFFKEGEATPQTETSGMTDAMGWYVANGSLDGVFTALAYTSNSVVDKHNSVNGTWLGNTADRAEATYVVLDGTSRGGLDFVVNRGEATIASLWGTKEHAPFELSTDRERDGATPAEPLEVTSAIAAEATISLGTFFEPTAPFAGFTSGGYRATVIHEAIGGSAPLAVDFVFEPSQLNGAFDQMTTIWNGRMLRSCSLVAPPCEVARSTDHRGDKVISMLTPSGGEASFVWGPSFLDIGVSIFRDDIEWLASEGVTRGCSPPINDLFCPHDEVTRGQMAAFLVRFLGLTDRGDIDFTDDDGSVFEANIEKLAAARITRGCNPPANDEFCPQDPVTREQMAAFLTRALKLPAATGVDFSDDDGSTFEDAIERLATAGITRGCNPPVNDRFCPSVVVTREQMAAFLHRADALRP